MNFLSAIFFIFVAVSGATGECPTKKTQSKLICYYSKLTQADSCKCSHVILPADADIKSIDRFREHAKGVKILITVNEFNQGLVNILKSSKVDGIEINLKKLDSKNDISDFISTVRSKLGANLYIVLSVPSKAETLAKYFDFKALSKNADLFILRTAFLGASKNVTFHPSRLSGLWDMQNTDSVVDLVSGLGAPLSKLVITAPVQAFKFKLQDEKHTAPGSPALEVQSITRDELCNVMGNGGNWTLERDQDQTGPYIFSKDQWIAFDDSTSIDIKAKYARVRGLAGMALKDLSQDGGTKCESSILDAAFTGLSRQARAPRGAVLHSLEREILETSARPLDSIQVSPYRISRVIDVEGNVHVIRKDTRTEFECSRQGYFVHPRSCGRFYRCVKFDQLSDEFSVFEFDCPAGLAFDSRVEVCVWPGSLPHASACAGSSEIAPVPRERFVCPNEPGYYADPENCRWFFACLDHGKSPLSAYEFRCPFGLVYDESRLLCEWPWLVPKCGSGYAIGSEVVYGGAGSVTLDQYDGLGVLGVTALGGLHGPLQQPVVYSNVGVGGLSVKSAQSLQSAGLLKAGYADGNLAYSTVGNVGIDGSSLTNTKEHGFYRGDGYDVKSQGFVHGSSYIHNADAHLVNTGLRQEHVHNADTYLVNTGLYQGHVAGDKTTNYAQYGTNLNYETGLSGAAIKSAEGYEGSLHLVGGTKTGYIGTADAHLVNGLAENYQQGGAVSGDDNPKSSVEYHGNTGTTYGSGTSGSINIVGGGYSAVGVATDGVQTNYADTVAHVTQSPVAVSSIPTVTSVPVPTLKVASGFESYNGGVVANVPELQHKLQSTSHGSRGFANISTSFVNLVSSTPSTVTVEDGYHYPKPTTAFVEGPAKSISTGTSFVQQNIASVQPVVTTYQKPVIVSTTQTPFIVEKVNVQPVVTTYKKPVTSFVQHIQPVVTTYQQPVIVSSTPAPAVVEKVNLQPVVTTYQKTVAVSTPAPVVVEKVNIQPVVAKESFVGYDYPKPAVKFEEAPVRTTGGSFSYQNIDLVHKTEGYAYPKPAVAFEEIPVKTYKQEAVSSFTYSTPSTIRPVVVQKIQPVVQPVIKQHQIVQPQIHVTSYNVPSTTVKPVIVEQPQVYVSSTPSPIQPIVKQQAVSFLNFQRHETVQPQLEVTSYNLPSSTLKPVVTPVVQQKPAIVSSFSISSNSEGYHYEKPKIVFEEKPVVIYQQPALQKTVVASQPVYSTYNYQTPVSTYNYKNVVKSAANLGYSYPKPTISFEETPASVTRLSHSQPAVFSSYSYTAPTVQPVVVQKQAPVVTSYTYNAPSTAKPTVFVQQPVVNTYVSSTPKSEILIHQQPEVTYTQKQTAVVAQPVITYTQKSVAATPKPEVFIQQQPVVTYTQKPFVSTYASSTPKPELIFQKQPVVTYKKQQPAVVSSFTFTNNVRGYDYPKPVVPFVEEPTPVVTSYENRQPVEEIPFVKKKTYVTGRQTNYQYVEQPRLEYKQPLVVSTTPRYEYKQQYSIDSGYVYDKPAIRFEEKPAIVETYEAPKVPKTFVSSTPKAIVDYTYIQSTPKPTFASAVTEIVATKQPFTFYDSRLNSTPKQQQPRFEYKQPLVVSTTPRYEYKQQYSIDSGYVYDKPAIRFEEKPTFVETYEAPKIQKTFVSSTPKAIVDYTYIQSTPRPTFVSAVTEIVAAKQPFTFYDSRLNSTPKPVAYSTSLPVVETVSTSRPISKYSFSSLNEYNKIASYVPPVRVAVTPAVVTTSRPIAKYSFSSQPRVVENYVAPIEVTPPTRDYLPVKVATSVPTEAYVVPEVVKVTTARPRVKVTSLPTETYEVPEVTTARPRIKVPEVVIPTREYLPVRTRVKVTPSSTYLPVEEEIVSTSRPVLKVARPKTIIKVNDFHPLLSAKLGAQCTCTSNTVRLRKKKLRIVVEDDDDDDGYVVDNENNSNDGVVVENYQYEPQKLDITPTPEIYIKSTTSQVIEPTPSPTYSTRKRVRVRPTTSTVLYESPVTQAAEIFVKKAVTPVVAINAVTDDDVKLAKTSLESRGFDRYGPGGWRSRNEKLQGTIDCQRAGLFRHPTQCNKFYACRWDCTKNRYTLHVFNCPVHLTFDNNLGACNWPSQGPACLENTLLPSD
ncbi:uncharacterized protein LOC123004333 isoform X2 [Tribolium madens]|uniref:uncharacterized protein LOC123004333 isoform X2 n=1 Tax=Tribolium madens TaxID=41895 RepID=UPI001CF72CE1|nr:uncharacterized protein LOC123004333 isoform X2 [Tribolium madens]